MTDANEQKANMKCLRDILKGHETRVFPARLSGDAYAPSKWHPSVRFGVAINENAFANGLKELDEWNIIVIFHRPRKETKT